MKNNLPSIQALFLRVLAAAVLAALLVLFNKIFDSKFGSLWLVKTLVFDLFLLSFLYFSLEPIFGLILKLELNFRYKLTICMVLLGFVFGMIFVFSGMVQYPDLETSGKSIEKQLITNLLLTSVIITLSILLFKKVGRIITGHLNVLREWTESIIKGDFDIERSVHTRDEIQELVEDFNKMRLSLKNSFEEIEERNKKLQIEAYSDKLTGLPNRKKLLEDLEKFHYPSIILLNIDSFQEINDFYGSEIGDFILKETGTRIQSLFLDDNYHIYKIGPDEYVIGMENKADKRGLEVLSIYFCEGIMDKHYVIKDNEIFISITAGISLAGDSDKPKYSNRQEYLLLNADMALKKAKELQKRYLFFDKSMEIEKEYEYNIKWTRKLKSAIKEDRIVPYFQPIVNNLNGNIEKYECLARLIDTDGSIIAPDIFLKVSKKAGLYRFITSIIIEKSIIVFRNTPYEFSFNLTVEDISDDKIRNIIFSSLKENLSLARQIIFEIVETESIQNYEEVKRFINEVKKFGCKIAIDDFGAGYSNFDYLMQLNVDYIKIDAILIKNMDTDINAQIITRTISNFARELKIKTISEYVHNQEIYRKNVEFGIDFSQGYYFGQPEVLLLPN